MSLSCRRWRLCREHSGFTLIEVLVVILVIGILAAIAIPTFLGQEKKADDAIAKSDVRNVVRMVEECKVGKPSYKQCDEQSELGGAPGIDWGDAAGQSGVATDLTGDGTYIAYSISKSQTDGRNHVFAWFKKPEGTAERFCLGSDLRALTSGGCRDSSW